MPQAKRQFAQPLTTAHWRVWLEPALQQRAEQTLDQIAAELARRPVEGEAAVTLADLALFFGYLSQAKDDDRWATQALRFLNAAIDAVAREHPFPCLIGGYPQVGWTITQLAGSLFDQSETEICQALDEAVLDYLEKLPKPAVYDLVGGLAGLGVYALARLPAPGALTCLQQVVQRLAERAEWSADGVTWFTAPELLPAWQQQICPQGYYNLGLAHGVPGVLVFLARACSVVEVRPQAAPLLEAAGNWLLSRLHQTDDQFYFPNWLAAEVLPERGRLAWCYGDLGSAMALLHAARCVGQSVWEAQALRVLRQAASCRGEGAGVRDAGLCHGAAGNAHLFNRLYQATGEPLFKEAAQHWYARVFEFRQSEVGVAGFAAFHQKPDGSFGWVESVDLVNGAVGIGLAMLAASHELPPQWDEILAVSLPPQ